MENPSLVKVTTQADEIFYIGDHRTYWLDIYVKERPELKTPHKSEELVMNWDPSIRIGPDLLKACFIHKDSCKSHEYDYISTLEKPVSSGKVFHIFKFCNDIYYIEEGYEKKYKDLQDFVFLEKIQIMYDLLLYVKEAEGMYRPMKREFYVYSNHKYVYIINSDSLYQWKIYKEKFHTNEEFCMKHTFAVPIEKCKWRGYYRDDLLPFYTEEEVIRITKGIYRTRNIIPEKASKKYSICPGWYIEPFTISNKEDYLFNSPEFYSFKTLSDEEYLININNIDEWHELVEKKKFVCGFLYKKFLYSVQPYEYQLIKKGIYLRTKPVDPYKDSPPK